MKYIYLELILLGLLLAIMIMQLLRTILYVIFAPHMGLKVNHMNLFGLEFNKKDNKMKPSFHKLRPLCECIIAVDLKQEKKAEKGQKWLPLITSLLLLILIFLYGYLIRGFISAVIQKEYTYLSSFLCGLFLGAIVSTVGSVIISLYVQMVSMKRLGGYINFLVKQLRLGMRFEDMNIPPLSSLPYKNPIRAERILYDQFRLYYLYTTNQFNDMKQLTEELRLEVTGEEYLAQYMGAYYWLIFYYSYFDRNPGYASYFYEMVKNTIGQDEDSNAKRVLAYYNYFIIGNKNLALQYVREGLAKINSFSTGGEREIEYNLLTELNQKIQMN